MEQQEAVDAAVEDARPEARTVVLSYTFDIKILDAAGEELQPADAQKVKVSFASAEVANENLNTEIYHVSENAADGELSATALEVETEGEEATVETDGFSIYTVEFTYGDKEYVIAGGHEVLLSEILEQLGLSGTVESWEVSNPALFNIYL